MAGPPQFFYRYLFDTARRSVRSIFLIVLIDLLPLLGLWYLDWNAFNLVFIYFVETIVLLFLTWLKMRRAKYLLAVLGPGKKRQEVDGSPSETAIAGGNLIEEENLFEEEITIASAGEESHQARSETDAEGEQEDPTRRSENWGYSIASVSDYWLIRSVFWLLKSMLWLLRPLYQSGFLLVNLPLVWLQLYLLSLMGGDGWMPWNFLSHRLGSVGVGFSIPLLPLAFTLLVVEHVWFYRRKFLGEAEYENTGSINEGLRFQIRTIVQMFIMFAAVGLLISDTLSFMAAVVLVLVKVFLDVVAFLWNRMWGAAKNKEEGGAAADPA